MPQSTHTADQATGALYAFMKSNINANVTKLVTPREKLILFEALFGLTLYVQDNYLSVVSGSCTKQRIKCLAQGRNTVSLVSFELVTIRPIRSKILPLCHYAPRFNLIWCVRTTKAQTSMCIIHAV